MTDVKSHRRGNFAQLVKKLGGPREAAIKLDMNESQVSQLTSPKIQKSMGSSLARRIEKAYGLSPGQLDMPLSPDGRPMINVPVISRDASVTEPGNLYRIINSETENYVVWDNTNPYQPKAKLVARFCADSSLEGIANEGDLLIFDCWPSSVAGSPQIKPGSVVNVIHEGVLIDRILKQDPEGGFIFFSNSPLFAPIRMKDTSTVVGVLVEVRHMGPFKTQPA